MNEWDPLIVKGQHVIQLLNNVKTETLSLIRRDLGDMTFVNFDLIRVVEKAILNRAKKESLEQSATISVEPPDFWDNE
tara:strand:+ start:3278 stop:3511 length:234 start_codon:yes stop_codon:yes gene_type:complete